MGGGPDFIRAEHAKIWGETKVTLQEATQHVSPKRGPHPGGPERVIRAKNQGLEPISWVFQFLMEVLSIIKRLESEHIQTVMGSVLLKGCIDRSCLGVTHL